MVHVAAVLRLLHARIAIDAGQQQLLLLAACQAAEQLEEQQKVDECGLHGVYQVIELSKSLIKISISVIGLSISVIGLSRTGFV